jgi:hypothetical protein
VDKFSKRFGYDSVEEVEISIREEAPDDLRGFLVQLAYEYGVGPKKLRDLVCKLLRKAPDSSNWSEFPNIDGEVRDLVSNCKWYKVYDLIERLVYYLGNVDYSGTVDDFVGEINNYFIENGIGWKIEGEKIEIRGPESFEQIIKSARTAVSQAGLDTAGNELHEAINDLSRRPHPDTTGAIQHAMASLECVAREVTGDRKANLGDIMKKYKGIIPEPLDQSVIKAWGYASENGRHIREGREPTFSEAELIVGICASVGNYLAKPQNA